MTISKNGEEIVERRTENRDRNAAVWREEDYERGTALIRCRNKLSQLFRFAREKRDRK